MKKKKHKRPGRVAVGTQRHAGLDIIPYSLVSASRLLSKHWKTFLLMFAVQLAFMGLYSYVNMYYGVNALSEAAAIIESYDAIPDTSADFKELIRSFRPSVIQDHYNNMINYTVLMLAVGLLVWIILENLNWLLAHRLVRKTRILDHVMQFIAVSFIYMIPIALIISGYIKKSFLDMLEIQLGVSQLIMTGILFLAIYYFMFISYALIGKKGIAGLPDLFKKTFSIGTNKAHIILLSYLVQIAIMGIFGYLFYLSVYYSTSTIFTAIAIVILAKSIIYPRMFFVKVVDSI